MPEVLRLAKKGLQGASIAALCLGNPSSNAQESSSFQRPDDHGYRTSLISKCNNTTAELILNAPMTGVKVECPPSGLPVDLIQRVVVNCGVTEIDIRVTGKEGSKPSHFTAEVPCETVTDGNRYLYTDEEDCPDGSKYGLVVSMGEVGNPTFVRMSGAETSINCDVEVSK